MYDDQEVVKPKFNVSEVFEDTVVVQMNIEFADLLLDLLNNAGRVEPEIWAFKKALEDPRGCYERRFRKRKHEVE